MNLNKLIRGFIFQKFGKAGRTDFGVLKSAFMVAAPDGEVADAGFLAFDALAGGQCDRILFGRAAGDGSTSVVHRVVRSERQRCEGAHNPMKLV